MNRISSQVDLIITKPFLIKIGWLQTSSKLCFYLFYWSLCIVLYVYYVWLNKLNWTWMEKQNKKTKKKREFDQLCRIPILLKRKRNFKVGFLKSCSVDFCNFFKPNLLSLSLAFNIFRKINSDHDNQHKSYFYYIGTSTSKRSKNFVSKFV